MSLSHRHPPFSKLLPGAKTLTPGALCLNPAPTTPCTLTFIP